MPATQDGAPARVALIARDRLVARTDEVPTSTAPGAGREPARLASLPLGNVAHRKHPPFIATRRPEATCRSRGYGLLQGRRRHGAGEDAIGRSATLSLLDLPFGPTGLTVVDGM